MSLRIRAVTVAVLLAAVVVVTLLALGQAQALNLASYTWAD